jgi:hypothetical protein
MNSNDVYVRAYAARLDLKKPGKTTNHSTEPKWPDHALIFDCETRITADQTLTFGFWRFCELRDGNYVALEEGIFHDDQLGVKELGVLRKYARATKPETVDDGCDRLRLYSRSKLIKEVFGIAIQAKALMVGFNLPFDLSRIAVDWNTAQNSGWTLIMIPNLPLTAS